MTQSSLASNPGQGSHKFELELHKVEVTDHLRPKLHFTAPSNWINDPNGMVYYDGEYHLFYQYHPYSNLWGPMHWGHAVSTDLVNWQHLPIALYPDEKGYIFSGSGVIDWHNTAGFGKEAMVLCFTHHDPETFQQSQSLAYSLDKGRSWTKYEGNPVIATPPNRPDFRDPKVFWYKKSDGTGHWVMLLAAGGVIMIYTSPNLLDWQLRSEFDVGHISKEGVWETPDLFQLPVDESKESRWVLTVGVGEGAPIEKIRTRYFVGRFDGERFLNEHPPEHVLWADYGTDFYAAQSWSDVPDGRRLWLGWMSNWVYARQTPLSTWRGTMTFPRQVGLTQTQAGIRMTQTAVSELQHQRETITSRENISISQGEPFVSEGTGDSLEILAEFDLSEQKAPFGVRVQVGDGDYTAVGYHPERQQLFVDRTCSGQIDFHKEFAAIHWADHTCENETLRLHLFVDRSAIELFVDGGVATFAERVFPKEGHHGVQFYVEEGRINLPHLEIHNLKEAEFYLLEMVDPEVE